MDRVLERLRRKKDTTMDTSTRNRPPLTHLNTSSQGAGKKRWSKRDSMFSFISSRSSSDEKDRLRQQAPEIEIEQTDEILSRDVQVPLATAMTGALPTPRAPNFEEAEIEEEEEVEPEVDLEAPEIHRISDEVDMAAQEMPPSPTTTTAPSNLYLQPNLQISNNSFSSTTSTLRGEPLSPLPLIAPSNQASRGRHSPTHEQFITRTPQNRHSVAGTGTSALALQQRLQEREQRIADAWLKAEERRRLSLAWPNDPWRGGFGPPVVQASLGMPVGHGREFVGYGYFGMSGVGIGNGGVGPGFGGRSVPFTGAGYGNSTGGSRNRHSMISTRSTASGAGGGERGVGALRGSVREWLGRRTSVRDGVR